MDVISSSETLALLTTKRGVTTHVMGQDRLKNRNNPIFNM